MTLRWSWLLALLPGGLVILAVVAVWCRRRADPEGAYMQQIQALAPEADPKIAPADVPPVRTRKAIKPDEIDRVRRFARRVSGDR
jgi:hypothetical protein